MIVAEVDQRFAYCRGVSVSVFFDCRATLTALAIKCGATSIALDVHLEDGRVMDQPVDGSERHGLVRKHLAPFAERLVGGDQHGAPLVAASDQLEQHARLGLIPADVDDVIKDQAETSVLFELIGSRYERRSMLITANQPFGEWGKVFPDPTLSAWCVAREREVD